MYIFIYQNRKFKSFSGVFNIHNCLWLCNTVTVEESGQLKFGNKVISVYDRYITKRNKIIIFLDYWLIFLKTLLLLCSIFIYKNLILNYPLTLINKNLTT